MRRERGRKYKSVACYGLDGDALLFLSVAVQLLYFGQWPAQPHSTVLINVFCKVGEDLNISDIYG